MGGGLGTCLGGAGPGEYALWEAVGPIFCVFRLMWRQLIPGLARPSALDGVFLSRAKLVTMVGKGSQNSKSGRVSIPLTTHALRLRRGLVHAFPIPEDETPGNI